jgi:ABC-2 type transport system ATP-binding protein
VRSPAEPAVTARGLLKRFGTTTALAGVDLTVHRGAVLALLGPNGAGKTTTVEICEGFRAPDAGSVSVLGLDPCTCGDELRARIGVMPQGGGAYPGVHAEEMLGIVAACSANPLDPGWLLEILGLQSVRRTPYKRLSGGQGQRLSLACALVGRPELLFLDEPTSGLDPQARHLVWELVAALRRDGVTVLLTTHLMDEAEALADEVVIVDHGSVLASGPPDVLTAGVEKGGELRFRARSDLDTAGLSAALPAGCIASKTGPGEYLVSGDIEPEVVSAVTAFCARHGVLADDVRVGSRSLEELFLELTGRELRS